MFSEEEWKKAFGKKLHFAIKMSGMSIREFSKRVGVSRPTMYRYINGEIAPSGYIVFLISNILRLTPNYFIDVM